MRYIIDASVTASWLLPDENTPEAQAYFSLLTGENGFVPPIWLYEVTNICMMALRRGRLSQHQMTEALNRMDHLPVRAQPEIPLLTIRYVAERHKLTIYDAAYLELTLRLDGQLATFDKALAAAAFANGVLARA
jgi:predicted nucleic acid-binding protein